MNKENDEKNEEELDLSKEMGLDEESSSSEEDEYKEEVKKEIDEKGGAKEVITFIGVGGCGNNIVRQIDEDQFEFIDGISDLWAMNTSYQEMKKVFGAEIFSGDSWNVKAHLLSDLGAGGAGRVPQLAEILSENPKESLDSIRVPYVTFYIKSEGGGTGSGATPVIVNKRAKSRPGTYHIIISVLPFDDEPLNLKADARYGFVRSNEEADMVIVVDNQTIENNLEKYYDDISGKRKSNNYRIVNKPIMRLIDIISASRMRGEIPGILDFSDLMNFLGGFTTYEASRMDISTNIRWVCPFVWPIDPGQEYIKDVKDEGISLAAWLETTIDEGSLVGGVDIETAKMAQVFIQGDRDYIMQPVQDQESNWEAGIKMLADKLDISKQMIQKVFIPEENNLRMGILLYPPIFDKLRKLKDMSESEKTFAENSWRSGINNQEARLEEDVKKKAIEKIEEGVNAHEKIKEMYEELLKD